MDWSGAEGSVRVHPCGELMLPLSQAPSRGIGPDQRDLALRGSGGGLGKNVNMRIFLNFFQLQRLGLLKGEAQGSVWPSITEMETILRPLDPDPMHTHLYPPQDSSLGLRAGVCPLISPPHILLLRESMFLRRGPQRCGRTRGIAGVLGAHLAGLMLTD